MNEKVILLSSGQFISRGWLSLLQSGFIYLAFCSNINGNTFNRRMLEQALHIVGKKNIRQVPVSVEVCELCKGYTGNKSR
jgi:hypothetical protein